MTALLTFHHLPLREEGLQQYTLAVNTTLCSVALLTASPSGPKMETEQQFSPEDFACLLPLLLAYPAPLAPPPDRDALPTEAQRLATCLQQESVLRQLSLLGCEVLYRQGYLLVPRPALIEHHLYEGDYEVALMISPKPLLPEGTELIANLENCTLALISQEGAQVYLCQEFQVTPRQLAILVHVLEAYPDSCSYRDLYADYVTAEWLYGKTRNEETVQLLQHRLAPPAPGQAWEQAPVIWAELQAVQPVLLALRLDIAVEPSYLLVPHPEESP